MTVPDGKEFKLSRIMSKGNKKTLILKIIGIELIQEKGVKR
jgi:hypothetical protein